MNQNPFLVYRDIVLPKKSLLKIPTKRLLELLKKVRASSVYFRYHEYHNANSTAWRLLGINMYRVKQELAKREHVE